MPAAAVEERAILRHIKPRGVGMDTGRWNMLELYIHIIIYRWMQSRLQRGPKIISRESCCGR